jgi:hypothetical protein
MGGEGVSTKLRGALGSAALYGASARRVLARSGRHQLSRRLRHADERLVFVVGSPRSGTTFLAGAIGEVPGFVDLSEVTPLKAAIPELVALPEPEAADRIRGILERVRLLALVRGLRGVEQTPEMVFVLAAALEAYPLARALHLVRDGRDVVCSLLERGWLSAGRDGGDDAGFAYGPMARFWVDADRQAEFESASDTTRAAWAWRSYVSAGRAAVTAGPAGAGRTLEVRYESMARDPERTAQEIAGRLGADAAALTRALARAQDTSVGRFRRDLTAEQLAEVEREAGVLLGELGYL